MNSIILGILANIAAAPIIHKLKQDPSLEERMNACYRKAIEAWNMTHGGRLEVKDFDARELQKLNKYIEDPRKGINPSLKDLYDLWIEKMCHDEVCSNFLENNKLEIIGKDIKYLSESVADGKEMLSEVLTRLIELELKNDEKVVVERETEAAEEAEMFERDKATISELFCNFNCYAMDEYLQGDLMNLHNSIPLSNECWNLMVGSSAFIIFDMELKDKVSAFLGKWNELDSVTVLNYSPNGKKDYYSFFGLKHDIFISNSHEQAFYKIIALIKELVPLYRDLTTYVKTKYMLDLNQTTQKFLDEQMNYELKLQG